VPSERSPLHFPLKPDYSKYRHVGEYETVVQLQAVESAAIASRMLKSGKFGEARNHELGQLVERGSRARSDLVNARLWHAESNARRLGRPHEVQDLTQEALLGLLYAFATFDLQAGYRFDAYAELHMYHAVKRSLAADRSRRSALRDTAA
jgi:DNA-directed RNA polymerase sigma subunit (sigma70/sigma32)